MAFSVKVTVYLGSSKENICHNEPNFPKIEGPIEIKEPF